MGYIFRALWLRQVVELVQRGWIASIRYILLDATIALELLLQHVEASQSATNRSDAIQPSYLHHVSPVEVAMLAPPSRILMRLPNDVSH